MQAHSRVRPTGCMAQAWGRPSTSAQAHDPAQGIGARAWPSRILVRSMVDRGSCCGPCDCHGLMQCREKISQLITILFTVEWLRSDSGDVLHDQRVQMACGHDQMDKNIFKS